MVNSCLDGFWDFSFLGEQVKDINFSQIDFTEKLPVPGCFDVEPGYKLRRGIGVYRTYVEIGGLVSLTLDAIGPKGEIYWDGKKIADCILPFSREKFTFDAGVDCRHELCILIDNRADDSAESLFPGFYDFYRHGGIYRSVSIRKTPAWEISYVKVIPCDLKNGIAEVSVELSGKYPSQTEVQFAFDGKTAVSETISNGRGTWKLTVPDCRLWSPEHPYLHKLRIIALNDEQSVSFGMRVFEAKNGQFYLNGKSVKLIGYNRHDSHPDFGYAMPESLVRRDLEMIKKQGCNFIRGCHYPQSETVLDWCDRIGLFVWEESIGWGNDEKYLTNETFYNHQQEQARRMARKSINHPSVVLHGFMNELKSDIEPAKKLIHSLTEILHTEDPSRPVTYASNIPFDDIALGEADVISFNIYPGWYINPQMSDVQEFDFEGFEKALLKYETIVNRAEYLDKPYIISEIGGAALPGFHSDVRWSEEYQADLATAAFKHVLNSSRCSGLALWMFSDTRSFNDYRAPSRPRGFNNKGVVDEYRRPKMAWNAIRRLLKNELDLMK